MDHSGLTITRQTAASGVDAVLEGQSPAGVWQDLADAPAFQEALLGAVRDGATGHTADEFLDVLEEVGVDQLLESGSLRALALRVAKGEKRAALDLVAATRRPGRGRVPLADAYDSVLPLLGLSSTPPTVTVRMEPEFREQRREHRGDVLQLVAALAEVADVRLVASGLSEAWLAEHHREDLPVSPQASTPRASASGLAETAWVDLEADSREVRILDHLADEPAETLPYSAIYSVMQVSNGRVRQCINTLADAGLVGTFDGATGKQVELLEAGREFLKLRDEEIGRQRELADCVSGTGTVDPQAVDHARDGTPPTAGGGPYRTEGLARDRYAAAVAAAEPGELTLVPGAVDDEERRHRQVRVDEDADRVVVETSATSALQAVVSPAVALTNHRVLEAILTESAVAGLDVPDIVLRDGRCIGGLTDAALNDATELREQFVDWAEELEGLTRDLHRGEYEDRDRLRSAILRSAHGLYGSLAHLFDALGVDLVRCLRIPTGLDTSHFEEIATATSVATAIQSEYADRSAYRQLFEQREEKRAQALGVEVDAADPYGSLIGSFVVVGEDLHRLRPHLEKRLGDPADVHEDAPEFGIRIPIRDGDRRSTYSQAIRRTLDYKGLGATREAVSLLTALTGSPFDAAKAIHRGLQPESKAPGRDVRLDEVRVALHHGLDADRLCPDGPPTVGRIVHALLATDQPLSQTALAEAADVSTRSIRDHRATLEALDLVSVGEDGYRFELPFATDEERGSTRSPAWADGQQAPASVIFDVALAVVDDASRLGDPSDPIGAALTWPPSLETLRSRWWWADRLIAVLRPEHPDADPGGSTSTNHLATVNFGPEIEQTPLSEPAPETAATAEGD